MAHKDREPETEERPSERRRREKKEKERDPERAHKSSRRKVDGETGKVKHRRRRDSESQVNIGETVPELSKTMSSPEATSRSSLPYPSFSKAHSKEAVSSVPRLNVYTPDPTDVPDGDVKKAQSTESFVKPGGPLKTEAPLTPPETEIDQQKATSSRVSQMQEESATRASSRSSSHSSTKDRDERSKVSSKSKASTSIKVTKSKSGRTSLEEDTVRGSDTSPGFVSSTVDSNATSVAPSKVKSKKAVPSRLRTSDVDSSSAQDSSPKTPTQTPQFPPPDIKPSPSPFLHGTAIPTVNVYDSAVPPPPPPPPIVPVNIPRVDYLLQNGGLSRPVPKVLFGADYHVEDIFRPFMNILDQYQTVLDMHGSLAVATGYRSVARRLLDRLEVIFGRELLSPKCDCVLCQRDDEEDDSWKPLGWGDVLEWVSGRIELPIWPAFDFNAVGMKATEDGLRSNCGPLRPGSPVKMDPDIADEFREHYLRQTEKKKKTIDHWLSSCPETAASPPEEVDDETLTFTILTHLEPDERPLFNALLAGASQPLGSRAPTPFQKPRSEFIHKTGQAIQRLYRLPRPPRDPESSIYLLKNPDVHNLLITLTEINNSEWEMLISGRFEGFLWSGAESEFPSVNNSPNVSRNPTPANNASPTKPSIFSRITSPFSPNRNHTFSPLNQQSSRSQTSTPFTPGLPNQRQPVSNDEEMEMAVNSEIERNLYQNMEAFEDGFEELHRAVESIRQGIRQRNAGLSIAAQSRRTTQPRIVCGTPGLGPGYERSMSGFGYAGDGESEVSESENGWYDGQESEIAPSDSASQIGPNRHKRGKRRNERRTPAVVQEEEEDD